MLDELLEQPAAELLAPLLVDPEPDVRDAVPELAAGARVGRFHVVRPLGRGGMGIVYFARDPELDRPVALKLLPLHVALDPEARRRLLEEARAASALDHPRIETIYEVGTTPDGRLFIAMACYEGETLGARLKRGPLPVGEAVEIAAQVAEGLAAAHARGIVHRDIKPGNLILLPDGSVKIVDFGIAHVRGRKVTPTGATPGTVAYMSPEQTRSKEVDGRSDVWSLGVVLYEMLAGVRPFRAESDEAVIHAIRHEEPGSLRALRPEVPKALSRIVECCLRVDPGERPAGAATLLGELRARSGADGVAIGVRARRWTAATVCALVLAGAAGFLLAGRDSAAPEITYASELHGPVLAILPFRVVGPDSEPWGEGMVELLSANLDGVAGIRTRDPRALLARWSSELSDEGDASGPERSLEVARALGATHALEGSVVTLGSTARLTARIYDARTGGLAGDARAEGPADSLLALVDGLSVDIVRSSLADESRDIAGFDVSRLTTSSLPALEAYLKGERAFRRSQDQEALVHFQRAVEADSTFALALYRLSQIYPSVVGSFQLAPYYAQRAARLADRLPERERLLFRSHLQFNEGWPSAIGGLEEFVRRYPYDVEGWYNLGEAYLHVGESHVREGFRDALRRSLALDAGYAPAYIHLIEDAFAAGDGLQAAELIDRYARLAPTSDETTGFRLAHALVWGGATARTRAGQALDTLPPLALDRAAETFSYSSALSEPLETVSRGLQSERIEPAMKRRATWRLVQAQHGRGQFAAARANAEALSPISAARHRVVWYLSGHGNGASARTSGPVLAAAGSPPERFLVAALAAREGDASAAEREATSLLATARALSERGDSLASTEARALATLLRAYGDLIRSADALPIERLQQALSHLRACCGTSLWVRALLQYEFGKSRLANGEPEEARALLAPLTTAGYPLMPAADLYLGRALEALGRRQEAIWHYLRFVDLWRECDAELRPVVEEARRSLVRLEGGRRGP